MLRSITFRIAFLLRFSQYQPDHGESRGSEDSSVIRFNIVWRLEGWLGRHELSRIVVVLVGLQAVLLPIIISMVCRHTTTCETGYAMASWETVYDESGSMREYVGEGTAWLREWEGATKPRHRYIGIPTAGDMGILQEQLYSCRHDWIETIGMPFSFLMLPALSFRLLSLTLPSDRENLPTFCLRAAFTNSWFSAPIYRAFGDGWGRWLYQG